MSLDISDKEESLYFDPSLSLRELLMRSETWSGEGLSEKDSQGREVNDTKGAFHDFRRQFDVRFAQLNQHCGRDFRKYQLFLRIFYKRFFPRGLQVVCSKNVDFFRSCDQPAKVYLFFCHLLENPDPSISLVNQAATYLRITRNMALSWFDEVENFNFLYDALMVEFLETLFLALEGAFCTVYGLSEDSSEKAQTVFEQARESVKDLFSSQTIEVFQRSISQRIRPYLSDPS